MFYPSQELESKSAKLLANDEGFMSTLYKCPKGFNTIGYGFNLDKNGIPEEVAFHWLIYLIDEIYQELSVNFNFFKNLNDARKYVMINMRYQLGLHGLFNFKNFIKYLSESNYQKAADEMTDSQWHRDFPNRSNRLINIMIRGDF